MPSLIEIVKSLGKHVSRGAMGFTERRRFRAAVINARLELIPAEDEMRGAGAGLLEDLVAQARYVLLGEDHGIREIPGFARWVWRRAAGHGCRTLAVEAGACAAEVLCQWLADGGNPESLAAYVGRYPDTIAVYDLREECELLSSCRRTCKNGEFRLTGLDQEYFGAFPALADRAAELGISASLKDCLDAMRKKFDSAYAEAARLQDANLLFSTAFTPEDLSHLRLLVDGRNSPPENMLAQWIRSWEIYLDYAAGRYRQSNRDRALLMKEQVWRCLESAGQERIVFKLGAFHLYRGLNPVHNLDIGNLVAEHADASRAECLHILVMGIDGSCLTSKGIGGEYQADRFDLSRDPDSPFLALHPFFRTAFRDRWTVFDLRGLREEFPYFGPVSSEIERVIFGYDLMVLIPGAEPSTPLHSSAPAQLKETPVVAPLAYRTEEVS